jgi:phosphoglycerate dehydrogenase-like enzyme
MSNKPSVLITTYLEPEFVEQIRAEVPGVDVVYRPDLIGKPRYIADHNGPTQRTPEQEAEWLDLLAKADVLFDFDPTHRDDLTDVATNTKWIQSTSAGIGQFVKRAGYAERRNWTFCTASGTHARPLAEFALMAMLMFAKNYEYLASEKEAQHWARYCATELDGKTVGIVGLGKIGQETARLAKAFGMRVVGNRRKTDDPQMPNVDHLYPPNDLEPLLRESQFLVLAVPHTPETEGLIGPEQIAMLPDGAVVINLARGLVIDQKAMTEALTNGKLRGAALDVFEVEPLPAGDPLWSLPNVIISPHSASTADTENAKITALFIDNLQRWLRGDALRNVLDVERLY